jgi:hypothetical protein
MALILKNINISPPPSPLPESPHSRPRCLPTLSSHQHLVSRLHRFAKIEANSHHISYTLRKPQPRSLWLTGHSLAVAIWWRYECDTF